ncbi:MAG: alkyl hydroperoxide reductase subunit F, partial [Ilumatobacteraceae bacterium]
MLDSNLTAQLGTYLQNLTRPIELVAVLDAGATSDELRALLDEIAELSELITVRDGSGDAPVGARRPSFTIRRVGADVSVGFAGIPLG